jgi:hypothetical protein
MVSSFHVSRVAVTTLVGLMTVLIGLVLPGITPQLTAHPQEGGQPTMNEAAPPRMVLSNTTHDAGQVERGEMVTHRFTFRNTGGSDLVILSTKAG